ncbi:MAG TPA: ABC transporter permease [Dehalococcoidales bacterium]|nr:ABC transporter permease [Dehalococcoidales bacterium]
MKWIESFIIALRSLSSNKLRSSLTMLGVIIGVGSVITLMSVGRGAEKSITSTLEGMGTNLIYIVSQTPGVQGLAAMGMASQSLTISDAEAIAERVPSVVAVAPVTENYAEVAAGDESAAAFIEATTPEYEQVLNYPTEYGQFISARNVASRDMVTVLGSKVASDLFGDEDAVGKKVKINGRQFNVIGVLAPKGGQMMGISMDAIIVVPITTYQARLFPGQTVRGEDAVQQIAVQIESTDVADMVSADITELLTQRHRITEEGKEDFLIMTQEQMMGMIQQVTGLLTILLGAIASISLLVGSIGIMNIMLVSVTERTREIGIRKAVGAKRRDILLQFLLEAAMLSLSGGAVGIIGGWVVSWLISTFSAAAGITINALVSWDIVVLAISVSVFIGLISGIYPAMRAARLNPIDALHYE